MNALVLKTCALTFVMLLVLWCCLGCVRCASVEKGLLLNYKKIEKIFTHESYDFTFMILGNLNGQTGKTP